MTLTKRDLYLRKKYGITEAIYFAMSKHGDHKCWICKREPKVERALSVDHAHGSKQVRGLLCFMCNRKLIGRRTAEHAYLFENAAAYLRSTKDWRQP
jgi:hypothetical protein